MQNTRRKYHQAVKIAKQRKTKTLCEKLAKSIQNKNISEFWKHVKTVKRTYSSVSAVIDGMSSDKDISELFGAKFNQLYNSVSYDINELSNIQHVFTKKK